MWAGHALTSAPRVWAKVAGVVVLPSVVPLQCRWVGYTGVVPPFWYEGKWCLLEDSSLNSFVLPGMSRLYRNWVRAISAVGGLEYIAVDSGSGAPFAGFGARTAAVVGRIPLHPVVVEDLSSLSGRGGGVASLRFPSFW